MVQKSKNGNAFFERGSWYYRIKWYDEDYLMRYGKKGDLKQKRKQRRVIGNILKHLKSRKEI